MIDKNGRKISNDTEAFDSELAFYEIKFLMKGFSSRQDDRLAERAAELMHKYVKNGGSLDSVREYFDELEEYAPKSASEDFLWYPVYIRRIQVDKLRGMPSPDYMEVHKAKLISAGHFEHICRVNPSNHNKRVRANEYINAILYLGYVKPYERTLEEMKRMCDHATELFSDLTDDGKDIYYDAGRLLYYLRYICAVREARPNAEDIKANLKKAIGYSYGGYELNKREPFYVSRILDYYGWGMEYKSFAASEDLEILDNINEWLDEMAEEHPADMRDLKKRISNLRFKVSAALT